MSLYLRFLRFLHVFNSLYYMLIGRFEKVGEHVSITVSDGKKIFGIYFVKKTLYIGCSCGKEWKNELDDNKILQFGTENTWQ